MPATATRASRSSKAKPDKRDLNPSHGGLAVAWIETNLIHGEGDFYQQPFRLTDAQKLFLWRWYEYVPGSEDEHGRPEWVHTEAFKCDPKGEGKTELCAAIACLEMAGPPQIAPRVPDIPIAAAAYKQADWLFGAASIMLGDEAAPLGEFFNCYEGEITFADGRPGRIYKVAAKAGTNDGGKATLFVADEVHEWLGAKERVHTVISNGTAKRRNCRTLSLSTVGAGLFSDPVEPGDPLWWKLYVQGLHSLADPESQPRFLFDLHQAAEHWDLDDPDQLEAAVREASPAADVLWPIGARLAKYTDPKVPRHEFLRYFLNRPTEMADESWLAEHPSAWRDCEAKAIGLPDGATIKVAVDMSRSRDSTAVVWGAELDDRAVVRSKVWTPEPGKPIDHLEVLDFIRGDLADRFDVAEVAYDPRFFDLMARELDLAGFLTVEFPQSPERMVPACGHAYDEILGGVVAHDGDPTLARHVAAAVPRFSGSGWMLDKGKSGHSDACVALVMLLWRLRAVDEATSSVYEERGLVEL